MNTPANRGGDGTHSRGGGRPVCKDQSPTILSIFEIATSIGMAGTASRRDGIWFKEISVMISIALITGNSSLEPLIEGLCAQIHVNLS